MKWAKGLALFENLLLGMVVFYALFVPQIVRKVLLLNTDYGHLRFMRFYFILIPFAYLAWKRLKDKSLRFPLLIPFVGMVGGFTLMEQFVHPGPIRNFEFVEHSGEVYVLFLLLVNFGLGRAVFLKVLRLVLVAGAVLFGISYLGYFEVIPEGFHMAMSTAEWQTVRPEHVMNINTLSYIGAFSLLIVLMLRLSSNYFSRKQGFLDLIYLVFIGGVVLINGSRLPFLLILGLVFVYVTAWLKRRVSEAKARQITIGFSVCIALLFVLLVIFGKRIDKLPIFYRFSNISSEAKGYRVENVKYNLINFKEHPFLGVGYHQASKRDGRGTVSNTQYTLILASAGIFVFLFYLVFQYRFALGHRRVFKFPEAVLSGGFYLICLLFTNPLLFMAVIGYVTQYYQKVAEEVTS